MGIFTRLSRMKRWDESRKLKITERLFLRVVLIFVVIHSTFRMHFEKGRRLNVGTLVSAEKVPESLDFCHHDLSARFILNENSSFSHVSPMLECLGWDSPKDRRLLLQASMFYKIYMGDEATPSPTRVNRSPNHQLP